MASPRLFKDSALPEGERRLVDATGKTGLVMHCRGALFAVANPCPTWVLHCATVGWLTTGPGLAAIPDARPWWYLKALKQLALN